MPPARRQPRRGAVLAVVTLLLVVLVAMVAFAVDLGRVAHARTTLQATADAAALAGLARVLSGREGVQDFSAGRAEVRVYAGGASGNQPGLAVADADIRFGYYDPAGPPGGRFSTDLTGRRANAARVTLRQDGTTNPRLALSFSKLLGKSDGAVRAVATAWSAPVDGVVLGAPVIPYVAHVDDFNAAAGRPARPATAPGFRSVNPASLTDQYSVGNVGSTPTHTPDGAKELLLFDGDQKSPGNFGSVDLGSASNGTPDLVRQLLYGPNAADYALMQSAGKLAADGSLQAPVALGGDTGVSNGTKSAWEQIVGQNRVIPLYSTVSGSGNNAAYQVVGFAGVRIVDVDLQGNPKRVWVQPTDFYSTRATPAPSGGASVSVGVYAPPRLVIP